MMAIWANAAFLVFASGFAVTVGYVLWRHGDTLITEAAVRGEAVGANRPLTGLVLLAYGLVAVGAAVLLVVFGEAPQTSLDSALFVGWRLGVFLIVLGATHFKCLTVLSRAAGAEPGVRVMRPRGSAGPRRAREDPLDRVVEAARLNAPSA